MISKEEQFHTDQVELIKLRPSIINLEGIVLSTGESTIFRKNGLILREPDGLMFDPYTHTLYNIEYKTNDTQSAYQKAKIQLRTSGIQLQKIFKYWKVKNLYISADFKIKELK